jgi:hypothetical protein
LRSSASPVGVCWQAAAPLGRYGHQRHLFEMVLRLVLVQERRLPVKPTAGELTSHFGDAPASEILSVLFDAQRSALTCAFAGQYSVSNEILTMETLCRLS